MNHPLLKKLSLKASGTISHSIEVGNLAEAAAKAKGANSLLTRVGCYYHDIGKMVKSEYFVENQNPGNNKHDSLSPSMSAIVLGSHVKEGLNLAKEYGLPSAIRAFIPEHHGTSRMEYFLHKAKELNPDIEIDEESYRYPGPKPQSKETAIVMLADSIEAASRTLKEPSASRIKALIDEITRNKMADGQLDDSKLTLNEITHIKEAFAFYLMSKFHLRIEYPDSSPDHRKEEANSDSKKNQESNSSTSDKKS
jgi:putative nucleotidyltransferase with HDIG domain